ncbi:hypothetical protein B0A48_02169 [Cryoendolithus antarcticus]|uniref:Transcription factor domain-containing protein n=1 Tax=Cryoendolithus antarcticus TaxID=1507870 RepID=A0A1V8TMV5_9PEZI|nr:hypothetical protein B0A48_02169 [Cryoendolithus antarcticus]
MADYLHSIETNNYNEVEYAVLAAVKENFADMQPFLTAGRMRKLADAISLTCSTSTADEPYDLKYVVHLLWGVIIDIASVVPHHQPWHDRLVGSLILLRQRGEIESAGEEGLSWQDLPGFGMAMTEQWNDPTFISKDTTAADGPTFTAFRHWENLNSFTAKLSEQGFRPWKVLPIWQLRTALEEPLEGRLVMHCRLWVAAEWLTRCADLLYRESRSTDALDEATAQALRPGTLYVDIQPLSLRRWEFWKSLIEVILEQSAEIGYESAVVERLRQAHERMTEAEPR